MSLKSKIKSIQGEHQVLTASMIADQFKVSKREANNALAALAREGELVRVGRGHYTTDDSESHTVGSVTLSVPADTITYNIKDQEVTPSLIDWITERFNLNPDEVTVAVAYYSIFLADE